MTTEQIVQLITQAPMVGILAYLYVTERKERKHWQSEYTESLKKRAEDCEEAK